MKPLTPQRWLAFALAAGVAAPAAGVSLGGARGLPLMGSPLELTVPLLPDAAGAAWPECASADVFYGDRRVDTTRVSAQLQGQAGSGAVRVLAGVPVDTRMVIVYLHLGCSNRFTRKLVLMAGEPPPRAEPAVTPATQPVAEARPRSDVAPRSASASRPSTAGLSVAPPARTSPSSPATAPASPPPAAREPIEAAAARAASASSPRTAASATRAGAPSAAAAPTTARSDRSRLKLHWVDTGEPPMPALRLTGLLAEPVPAEAPSPQRAAAAAMWRALSVSPEDLAKEAERVAGLQRELAGLRTAARGQEAEAAQWRTRAQEAEHQRYANPLVFGLVLWSVLTGAAAAWLLMRQGRKASSSRHDADSTGFGEPGTSAPPRARERPEPPVVLRDSGRPAAAPQAVRMPDSGFQSTGPGAAAPREVHAEELHDVQQEAQFFMATGEHDKAIEALRLYIGLHPATSAIAWLDLLEIYHRLGRREEFDYTRGEFERNFNAQVPAFDAYQEGEGPGLEGYDKVMSRITSLWPSPPVLEYIEDLLFRPPGHSGRPAFSLEAYGDLLQLHHLAEGVLGRPVKPSRFQELAGSHPVLDLDFDLEAPPAGRS